MSQRAPDIYERLQARTRNADRERMAAEPAPTRAVILAGGRGTRLAPYTSVLPKPLMPIGDRSILEIVVAQLARCDISKVSFCVGYLSHLIRAVFENRVVDNGARPVEIEYIQEHEALGTAAPLRLVGGLDDTFIAMNGDVLTDLDYRDLVAYHRASRNILTIATYERAIKIDYGILHFDVGQRVRAFEEKPEVFSSVSMGIYVMEPAVVDFIPPDRYFDFPDLVGALLDADEQVGAYRYGGLWFDIGRPDDYHAATAAWAANGNGNGDGKALHSVPSEP